MEDCKIGKVLKQSTCRYVKECKRGWKRNENFICRKTERRLKSPKSPQNFIPLNKTLSRIEEGNENVRVRTKSKVKTPKKKLKIGNSFTYVHPDGRKEKVVVTGLGENNRLEVHIPSLAKNLSRRESKFKKDQKVFFIYKSGMKEQGIIQTVYDGEYDVQLLAPPRVKRLKENQLKAMSDYKLIKEFPYYVLKNA